MTLKDVKCTAKRFIQECVTALQWENNASSKGTPPVENKAQKPNEDTPINHLPIIWTSNRKA